MSAHSRIFVFGSNLAGRHGAGSAKAAVQHHGAIYGCGVGKQNNSYAIPTKDRNLRVLPLTVIHEHVAAFLKYALAHPEWQFDVVAIGCGLAGYKPEQIAPMFAGASLNVHLPQEFQLPPSAR